MAEAPAYPTARVERDRFVLDRRGIRARHDPWRHQGVLLEDERDASGALVKSATVFLTGRECPWRCVMCDLWKYTLPGDTPPGGLVQQLDAALEEIAAASRPVQIKLYNAGSFFDPRAVPEADYDAIAARLGSFRRVIVESHPELVGARFTRFAAALATAMPDGAPQLEVAMGLETAHPDALDRLNKGFTLDEFARSAERLRQGGASLRVFLLVGVPFVARAAQLEWIARSVSYAFACGATAVALIPTRPGNGALEALTYPRPTLVDLEAALERTLPGAPGRVFADLWDLQRFADCPACFSSRRDRLQRINHEQQVQPSTSCARCGAVPGRPA